jgi:hypothetical protein
MLAGEIASQRFRAVSWRRGKIAERGGVAELHQFAAGDGNPFRTRRRRKISSASGPRKLLIIA